MRIEPTVKATGAGFIITALTVLSILRGGSPVIVSTALLIAVLLAVSYAEAVKTRYTLATLRVSREVPVRIGEGSASHVKITVENPSKGGLPYLVIEDRVPPRVRAKHYQGRITIKGGDTVVVEYLIEPAPGYHVFNEMLLSTGDPLGFFRIHRVVKQVSSITVTPVSLQEMVMKGLSTGVAEPIVSRTRGLSLEYFQLREYQYGDDLRFVSWTATARTGKLMVREGLSEVRNDTAVFVDLSGPSWPGTPGDAPADWIMRLALAVASTTVSSGGSIWYTILRGEVWESEGPLRGRDAVESFRLRLSIVGPDNSVYRMKLEDSLYKFLRVLPPSTLKIVLLGPGANLDRVLDVLKAFPGASCTTMVLVVAPMGGTLQEEAVRIVEERVYREYRDRFAKMGILLGLVRSRGEVIGFARGFGRLLSRGRFC
ncbi:MAG: DUF58 domain-containing protein [Desulfurococcales archaeon]|nr:DUF58 domain-containing protein [Desulfurococcales archaeon]